DPAEHGGVPFRFLRGGLRHGVLLPGFGEAGEGTAATAAVRSEASGPHSGRVAGPDCGERVGDAGGGGDTGNAGRRRVCGSGIASTVLLGRGDSVFLAGAG